MVGQSPPRLLESHSCDHEGRETVLTRRQFVQNLSLAGFGIPLVHGVGLSVPDDCQIPINLVEFSFEMRFWGGTETPICDGESVKDLRLYDGKTLRIEEQCNGSTIITGNTLFIVLHGKYHRLNELEGDENT